jgi:hypothetical protein
VLRALSPQPAERSLWRFLEVEGPALLIGSGGALWSEEHGAPRTDASNPEGGAEKREGEEQRWGRRLSLEVKSIAIARDPTVYGVARVRARLLTWADDKIVDEQEQLLGLPVDLSRLVDTAWPEGDALARVEEAAAAFRRRLARRLSALVDARQPTLVDVLGGAAFLRVLARAATGDVLDGEGAEPPGLREVADGPEDEIGFRLADVGVLVLSPADDVVKLRTGDVRTGTGDHELFVDGVIPDGDVEAWRAFAEAFAQAIVDADLDVELAFPSDESEDEVETVMLSSWLVGLAEREDDELRWPPRAHAAETAAVYELAVDRFVDRGPAVGGRR